MFDPNISVLAHFFEPTNTNSTIGQSFYYNIQILIKYTNYVESLFFQQEQTQTQQKKTYSEHILSIPKLLEMYSLIDIFLIIFSFINDVFLIIQGS